MTGHQANLALKEKLFLGGNRLTIRNDDDDNNNTRERATVAVNISPRVATDGGPKSRCG